MNYYYLCNWKGYLVAALLFIGQNLGAEIISEQNTTYSTNGSQGISTKFITQDKLIYDTLLNRDGGKIAYALPPGWDAPVNTGNGAGVIIALEADPKINDISIDLGDAIGAFFINDDGEMQCAGVTHWPDTNGIVMTVFGDNYATPEKDGFSYGEYINYKIFSWEYFAEFDVDAIVLDPDFNLNNVWIKMNILRLLDMTCYEDLWIKAVADKDSLCNEALVSFDIEIIEGIGNITYSWASIPPGFSSTLPNPVFNVSEATLFSVEANDGINQFTAMKEIYVSNDPVVFAGDDIATCGVELITLSGTANFVSSYYWTSSGDGTFSNPTSLITDYYFGYDDFQSNTILFNLIGLPVAPCQIQGSDEMVVEIYPTPYIILPESFSTCKNQPVLLVAEGGNLSEVLWETEGNGTFSDPTLLTTTYQHGSYGSSHNSVTLTLTGHGIDPCNFTVIEQTELYINKNAFCFSGSDATICGIGPFLTCGGAAYADSIWWTTDGDGTFEDNTLLKSLYYPGTGDISNESVDLTIHVTSAPPCTAAPYSEMTLSIYDGPTVYAGPDIGACGNPIIQLNATADMFSSVEWSTSGSGTFEDSGELSTIYTASEQDLSNGTVELTIQAFALPPCTESSYDILTVNFEGGATASAGPDMAVCYNESANIQGWAINYQSLLWTTSGDGDFSDPNSPVTIYTPGSEDIMNGEVSLTINPEGIPPCTSGMSDVMSLSIIPSATLSVTNTEIEICENDKAYLYATATNFSNITWTSSGNGEFDDIHSLSPVYIPGLQDIQAGIATLEISISSIQPCTDLLNVEVELSIYKNTVASAGNNGSVCEGGEFTVNGTILYGDESEWMTAGDGYFENPFATETVYHPGNYDLQQANVTLTFHAFPVLPCEVSDQDELILYIIANPTCNAGNDKTICEGNNLELSGSASVYQSVYWESTGDGSFSDINDLNASYYPGQSDIGGVPVTLTLTSTAQSPCSIPAQDNLDLTIESLATVNAGADITICATDFVDLSGMAQNYQTVLWNSNGDGTFENPSTLNTIYQPGPNDIINRDIELCLTVTGSAFCESVTSCMNVYMEYVPVVNAGNDATSPVNTPYYTEESEAYYYSSVLWTTSGTGTFGNPNFISNHYTPSQSDLENSPINLTLTAQAINPCMTAESDSFVLSVIQDCVDAYAYAGIDATFCVSQYNVLILSDAHAENAETVLWSTNGDGVFTNNTLLQPVYIAGVGDKQNGSVELCLTANAYGTCENDEDCLTLILQAPPTANAGSDQSICQGDMVNLTGLANNAANTIWTSEGDGYFENYLSPETKYIPGISDIQNGGVELCLEAFGIGDCGNVSSCINILINKLPSVEAGNDQTICEGNPVFLSAEAENASAILWESDGDGSFDDEFSLYATYFPGENDIQSGTVELCIQAEGSNNCGTMSDCMNISIFNPPLVNAGANETICEGESIQLSAFAENYDQLLWEASGDGTFNTTTTLTPIYFPGNGDTEIGSVEICLTASGLAGCESVTSCMALDIFRIPVVEAGNNITVCENQVVVLNGISSFTTSVTWSTSGDGTFDNPDILNAEYTPGSEDNSFGNIQLCLSGVGLGNCQATSDCLLISIVPNPTAIAGSDITICGGDIVYLNGYATNNTSSLWQSSGTGTFGNPEHLQTTYIPCAQAIIDGYVQLCLSAFGNEGCTTDESCLNVTIQKLPYVFIGNDITVCSNSTIQLNAEVDFIDGLQWSTNGSGTFSNPDNISTTYFPSTQDVQQGFVEVCIEVFGIGACENQQICKVINFEDAPTAYAGIDFTICEGQPASLMGIAENYSSILWISQGDGTFNNSAVADAKYFPGPSDIETGEVSICMEALSIAFCDNTSDCLILKIQKTPEVYAGENLTFYAPQPVTTNDAYAYNSSSVYWETSGSGTFDTSNTIITTYTPSMEDYQNPAIITLSIFALPESPCTLTKNDDLVVEYFLDCFNAIANAGDDAAVCGGSDYQLNGEASEYSSVLWTSAGTGTFDNAYALDAIYTPGEEDITNAQVELCLTAFANDDCEDATDCMTLTFVQPVIASAGSSNTVWYYEPYTFPDAFAENASLIQWTNVGGIGDFINENTIHPTYYPSSWDLTYDIQFTLQAYSNSPCTVAIYDVLVLTFIEECANAIVDAGEDINICEGNIISEVSLENAFASNFKSLLWSTSGDGTFNFSNALNPVYTLGSNDVSSGNAELSLFAEGWGECSNATDQLIIQTSPAPVANAGIDITVCGIAGIPLFGSASEYTSLEWTTNGDGAFIDASGLNPIYYPGNNDLENGAVELCLLASGIGNCPPVSDCMNLTIIPLTTVNPGNDDAICAGESYQLNATASDYSALLWSTNGDGTFNSNQILNPVYTPGSNDIESGSVILILNAYGMGECGDISGTLVLTIIDEPLAFAGVDATINLGENYQLQDASAENAFSLLWESSGLGTFQDNTEINTTYYPAEDDYPGVTLTLSALPLEPCSVSSSDEITITIIEICQDAVADAGEDIYSCNQDEIQLFGSAQNEFGVLWTTDGDGVFDNANDLLTSYYPGTNDLQSGIVEIHLTAFADEDCNDNTDDMIITLYEPASADAGEDIITCDSESAIPLSGSAFNFSSLQWTTSGSGTFIAPNSLSSYYILSPQDKALGEIYLILTASNDDCGPVSDTLKVTINSAPYIFVNPGATICGNEPFVTNGYATNYTTLYWSSGGDGTFDNMAQIIATYYPGLQDIQNGSVQLCLTAVAFDGCDDISECLTLTLNPSAFANAGNYQPICEDDSLQLLGQAEDFETVLWETFGDGTFENQNELSTIYFPGIDDIVNNQFSLQLTAYSSTSCGDAISQTTVVIIDNPEANAGLDQEICETSFAQLNGFVENTNEVLWESAGDGDFDDKTSVTAKYYPGEADIANGNVSLCLTAFADGSCQDVQDCMVVNIEYAPSANAGLDDVICETDSYQLNGAAENFASVNWQTNGDGTFDNPASLTAVYYPGVEDAINGFAELVFTAFADGLCQEAIDNMILSIEKSPVVVAGDDLGICETAFAQLNGFVENTNEVYWESDGDGDFDDKTSVTAIYYPGETDIANGVVELCLLATGLGSCNSASDCLTLSIQQQPEVILPENFTVCEGENIDIVAAAENYSLLLWTSDGDGTFDFNNQLNVIYSPGTTDIQNESVNLCLSASGISGCEDVFSCLTVGIQQLPEVIAGENQTICENDNVELTADATSYDAIIWSSTGDGTFSSPETLIGNYQPGPSDIESGFVDLCITATGINGCTNQEDCVEVTIITTPTANAGNDQTICQSQTIQLSGSVSNATSHLWETTGDGTFGNASNLNTSYYPGDQDNLNMNVELCLNSYGSNYCQSGYDCISVVFMPGATSYAGEDISICKGENAYLSGTVTGNSGLIWTTNGTGNFNNPQLLNPFYMPSTADIENGSVTLCLYAFSVNGCGTINDCLTLTINKEPIINAGEDISVCENEFATLNGSGENYINIYWNTNGDGTFEDTQDPGTNYYPGLNDLETGLVNLCLLADGLFPCSGSSDCITLNIYKNPTVSFDDLEMCLAESIPVSVDAQNYQLSSWQTMGDGTFEDAGMINTNYYPGEQDIANMQAEICLTLTGNSGCGEITECMAINFTALPYAYAGNNGSVALDTVFELSEAIAENSDSIFWTSTGLGYFENPNLLNTNYIPNNQDLNLDIQLILHAVAYQPCQDTASDTLYLHVYTNNCIDVEVYAGEDQTLCENVSFTPVEATVYFATDLLWTTTGDGTFDDPTELYTVYTPGESDIASGNVILKINGFGQESCNDDLDMMELSIQHNVIASAGNDNTIPYSQSYTITDSYAEYASLVQWTVTGGTGELENGDQIHPTYFPTLIDTLFTVQLNMTAISNSPCTVAVTDALMLNFTGSCNNAIADAGENIIICANDSIIQLQGYAANFSGLSWTTGGDGTFDFANSASPIYTLGQGDKISGELMLYFYAESFGNCSPAIDSVMVSPSIMPQVDAGLNQTICEGEVFTTDQATVTNFSSVEWSTSGDGTFSEISNIETQYTPGVQDFADGTVFLTISALSLQPCQVTVSKTLKLTIDKLPELQFDVEDFEAEIGQDAHLIVLSRYAKSYQWYGPDGLLDGETLPILLMWEVDFDDAGYYYCELTNDCGISISNQAKVSVYEQQPISIPAGWSGLSSYITPANSLMVDVFSDYMDDLVMIKNFSGIYNPSIGVNTLVNWNNMVGYEANFDQPVEFIMKGMVNESRTITINQGWNIIPVISSCPVNIDQLFDGHTSKINIIKEIAGVGVYWPAIGINTIGNFIPGRSYCMRVSETFEVTYEACGSTKSAYIPGISRPENHSNWNNLHYSPSTHTIAIDQLLLDELQIGDIIGAFTSNGRCAGYLEINIDDNVIVLFGDDPLTEIADGFVENEPIHFRIYNAGLGREVDFYPEFSSDYPQNDGVYVNNGMSRLIKASVNGIGNDESVASIISIFPNPTFGKIMISGLSDGSIVEVWNSEGQMLREVNCNSSVEKNLLDVDLSDCSSGMVYVRIYNHNQMIIKKIVIR